VASFYPNRVAVHGTGVAAEFGPLSGPWCAFRNTTVSHQLLAKPGFSDLHTLLKIPALRFTQAELGSPEHAAQQLLMRPVEEPDLLDSVFAAQQAHDRHLLASTRAKAANILLNWARKLRKNDLASGRPFEAYWTNIASHLDDTQTARGVGDTVGDGNR
jgi:hypothetical protein